MMPANEFVRSRHIRAAAIIVAGALALAAIPAAAQAVDPERQLQELDRNLHDSESRRDALRRHADRTANEISTLKRRLMVHVSGDHALDAQPQLLDLSKRHIQVPIPPIATGVAEVLAVDIPGLVPQASRAIVGQYEQVPVLSPSRRLNDSRRRGAHVGHAVELAIDLRAAQAGPAPGEWPSTNDRDSRLRELAHPIGQMVISEQLDARPQVRGRLLVGEALPRVVVSQHHDLGHAQLGDHTHHLQILVTEIADEERQVLRAGLEKRSILGAPVTMHVAHDEERYDGGLSHLPQHSAACRAGNKGNSHGDPVRRFRITEAVRAERAFRDRWYAARRTAPLPVSGFRQLPPWSA